MNEQYLEGIERLNCLPLNRKARQMLEETGVKIEPGCLHAVQLALWEIGRGEMEVETSLIETVQAMTGWSPERLANFLMLSPDSREWGTSGWMEAETPSALAKLLLDEIEAKMILHFPWYHDLR
jgi:hypothetical protein